MKRICILCCLLGFSFILFGAKPVRTDSITLQAGYGTVTKISVKEIPAQSASYIAGMPFNIEEDYVQWGKTEYGRRIANVDILSNQPFSLKVMGEPMTYQGPTTGVKASQDLGYQLTFEYQLGIYQNGSVNNNSGVQRFTYSSSEGEAIQEFGDSPDEGTYIGSVNCLVYFMFDQGTSSFISSATDATLPPGNYGANVVLEIQPIGDAS